VHQVGFLYKDSIDEILPFFCYVVLIDSFTLIAISLALPLDLFDLCSTYICVLVQIYNSCVEYFLAQKYRAQIFSFIVLATHIATRPRHHTDRTNKRLN
jgi:hypothetical protein